MIAGLVREHTTQLPAPTAKTLAASGGNSSGRCSCVSFVADGTSMTEDSEEDGDGQDRNRIGAMPAEARCSSKSNYNNTSSNNHNINNNNHNDNSHNNSNHNQSHITNYHKNKKNTSNSVPPSATVVSAVAPHVAGGSTSGSDSRKMSWKDYAQPPPPLPPHPVYGSFVEKTRKRRSGGGGGCGGIFVEALRPLMSANARTWFVVSVGGGGRGGAGAAWRALDVARKAKDISTNCIRLR